MFSSLASFIFGSTTAAASDTGKPDQAPTSATGAQRRPPTTKVRIDAANTIEVTSSTPSVTGSGSGGGSNKARQVKRGKNKRQSKLRRQALAAAAAQGPEQGQGNKRATPSIRKLLTPNESSEDETFDEDDWFIVENDDEDDSLPRTDSEEELSIVEVKAKPAVSAASAAAQRQQRRQHHQQQQQAHHPHQQQHINSHSLYSGPRPQQQRNYMQRARNSGARLNLSRLSPPRTAAAGGTGVVATDGGITQSLHAVPLSRAEGGHGKGSGLANYAMEGSWYVTPPPCFTSIGPIHMETSPFENLLIEHPSMSVYHSIRSQAQEATESFVNLDLGVAESQQQQQQQQQRASMGEAAAANNMAVAVAADRAPASNSRNTQVVAARPRTVRLVVYNAAQLKQELLLRSSQKSQDKKERQNMCRSAIKRANKVRDFSGKAARRVDMQYTKIQQPRFNNASNNNHNANNRKSCY